MNLDNIEVREYEARWNDEPDEGSFIATIAILRSEAESIAIDKLQEEDYDEFCRFDNDIFHYVYAYLGEKVEDLFQARGDTDFILIGDAY